MRRSIWTIKVTQTIVTAQFRGFLLRLRVFGGNIEYPRCVLFPNGSVDRVDTAMGVNADAAHPDVDGSGGAAGNAAYVSPSIADFDALRGHVDARLDEQMDILA